MKVTLIEETVRSTLQLLHVSSRNVTQCAPADQLTVIIMIVIQFATYIHFNTAAKSPYLAQKCYIERLGFHFFYYYHFWADFNKLKCKGVLVLYFFYHYYFLSP